MSRQDLQQQLAKLEETTRHLTKRYPEESDFISAFAGEADLITDAAGPEDYDWALSEIDRILTKSGYPPKSNELPPDE